MTTFIYFFLFSSTLLKCWKQVLGHLLIIVRRISCLFLNVCSGSDMEERDVRKAYEAGKGCINFMLNSVPFMSVEDEPRIMELVKGL